MLSIWAISGTCTMVKVEQQNWTREMQIMNLDLLLQVPHCLASVSSYFEVHSYLKQNSFKYFVHRGGILFNTPPICFSTPGSIIFDICWFSWAIWAGPTFKKKVQVKCRILLEAPVGSCCLPWKVPLYLPSFSPPARNKLYPCAQIVPISSGPVQTWHTALAAPAPPSQARQLQRPPSSPAKPNIWWQ